MQLSSTVLATFHLIGSECNISWRCSTLKQRGMVVNWEGVYEVSIKVQEMSSCMSELICEWYVCM